MDANKREWESSAATPISNRADTDNIWRGWASQGLKAAEGRRTPGRWCDFVATFTLQSNARKFRRDKWACGVVSLGSTGFGAARERRPCRGAEEF